MDESTDNEDLTTKSNVRWAYIGSVLSALIILWFCGLTIAVALGYGDIAPFTSGWFSLIWVVVVSAVGWLFGTEMYRDYKKTK